MKKIFTLALGLTLAISLISCGGSSETAAKEQAAFGASVLGGSAINSIAGGFNAYTGSVNTDTTTEFTAPVHSCTGGGTITGSGEMTVTDNSANVDIDTSFNACKDTDDYCNFDYEINGTMNTTLNVVAAGSTASVALAITGNVNVTAVDFPNFACGINLSLNIPDLATFEQPQTDEEFFELIQGTICGKTLAEINAMLNDPEEYCATLEELANETNA